MNNNNKKRNPFRKKFKDSEMTEEEWERLNIEYYGKENAKGIVNIEEDYEDEDETPELDFDR